MISIRALCPLDKGFGGREQDWTCSGQGVGAPVLCAEMPLAFLQFWGACGMSPGCHKLSEMGQTLEVCNHPGSSGAACDSSLLTSPS